MDERSKSLRVVASVMPFVLLAGCASATPTVDTASGSDGAKALHGRGETALTKNAEVTRDDGVVTQDVRKAISAEAMLKGYKISVATVKGEVQLGGVVKTTDERQRAEGLARTVPGVKEIHNQIELEK
jgi:osmotically-inducible protein OsmY